MDDAAIVSGSERARELGADTNGFIGCERTAHQTIGERRTLDQLQHKQVHAVELLDAVNGRDVRMIQRREYPGLAFEAGKPLRVVRERMGKHFEGDLASELPIACVVHLPHSSAAERADHVEAADAIARLQHRSRLLTVVQRSTMKRRLQEACRRGSRREQRFNFPEQPDIVAAGAG